MNCLFRTQHYRANFVISKFRLRPNSSYLYDMESKKQRRQTCRAMPCRVILVKREIEGRSTFSWVRLEVSAHWWSKHAEFRIRDVQLHQQSVNSIPAKVVKKDRYSNASVYGSRPEGDGLQSPSLEVDL